MGPARRMKVMFGRSVACALLVLLCACDRGESRDWAEIQERDTLVVLTIFNSTSYFSYRGEPMGLEYELLRDFAHANGVVLRTEVHRQQEEAFDDLRRGRGDVVAARLIPTPELERRVAFSRSLYATRPAVVQRTGPPTEAGMPAIAESLLRWPEESRVVTVQARPIETPEQLAGSTVHVPAGSPYPTVLAELSDTISGDIEVVEIAGDSATEALVRQVARGEIELAVSQENLARLTQSYFQNIEVRPAVGPTHGVAFAVSKRAPQLRQALDLWITEKQADGTLASLYRKYFVERRGYRERVESEYLTSETGRLSPYDSLLFRHAQALGWDWRLLAAQAYQESRFDPRARSWAGAQGLLQLMPGTARDLQVRDVLDPEQNVEGAVRFINQLTRRWRAEISDSTELMKFVLASYNTGPGHVQDAQRLAQKHGGNRLLWTDVAYWLLQKSKRAVYTDPVVRHGYSRGLEPVLYVRKILERYEHYRQFVPATPGET